ncbi:hypothetical protein BJ875DRAFT_124637 [Amylocarpus encephaloides]|uniref:RING-type E3 ubiquitin transferase n=1 Tax=Amylocarpus encephaloides TaxID=45428 RepID=A0A9P8C8T9_9HELO|nr:hypothetical protein BJ875DRAFT_124637 [Amylocarpus encephaloides]
MYSSAVPSSPWHPSPSLERTPSSPPLMTSPASPSRTSRLRGLSYLRTYTHNHILSRDNHHSSGSPNSPQRPGLGQASSYPSPITSPTSSAPLPTTSAEASTPPQNHQHTSPTAQRTPIEPPSAETSSQDSLGSTSGWLPTVGGRSGVSRTASAPQSTATASSSAVLARNGSSAVTSDLTASMARTRSATMGVDAPADSESQTMGNSQNGATNAKGMAHQLPSIRFTAHQDPRASRPSLAFNPMARILPTGVEIIKVGRYSERDTQPVQAANAPSAAPVGFKSKVVSRRHCEFWCSGGRWYIKDVKSSSGTFLNHIRLSSPGTESKPYPVNDGDIVQLGIDFKGGEEMIFRCVKIRVELNKGWQVGPNSFNVQSHKRLRELNNLGKPSGSGTSQDCAICLGPIAPCQSLFVAPCSHTWHYKCIRVIINGPHWPHFVCPNCRAVADLEAELEEPQTTETDDVMSSTEVNHGVGLTGQEYTDLMQRLEGEPQEVKEAVLEATTRRLAHEPLEEVEEAALAAAKRRQVAHTSETQASVPEEAHDGEPTQSQSDLDMVDSNDESSESSQVGGAIERLDLTNVDSNPSPIDSTESHPLVSNSTVAPVNIVGSAARTPGRAPETSGRSFTRTPSPNGAVTSSLDTPLQGHEGPMTPRNDVGPFIFDGSAGRPLNLTATATPMPPVTSHPAS